MSDNSSVYRIFAPKSPRGLKVDYPELSDYEEFKSLRSNQLFFVWLYACKSSPHYNRRGEERDIIKRCLDESGMPITDPERKEAFLSGNFPEKISAAVTTMREFEPSVRIKAKLLAAKHLEDIKKMVSLELDNDGNHSSFLNKDGEMDFTKRKQYMSMIIEANQKLPELIEKAEKGFSVKEEKRKTGDKNKASTGDTWAEDFHNNT